MTAAAAEAADIQEILRLLPHRYPFLMIDRDLLSITVRVQ